MNNFQLDARKWKFLDNHTAYEGKDTKARLKPEPLQRQFATVKEILERFKVGRGVLLADDVGLGKTTVGALVAWIVACQGKRVRIYAPNEVLRRRWAEELKRHVPMLGQRIGARGDFIRQGDVQRLHAGRIQVTTHHALVRGHDNGEQRTACDLMIIDEAHRAKGDGSAFNEALRGLGDHAKRKLILTATPFSIRITELEQLLYFAGATQFDAIRAYAGEMSRLYGLGTGADVEGEARRLVKAARDAIAALQPYVIRHGVDDISAAERAHFGTVAKEQWDIPTPPASTAEIQLLLRMDRLLQLTPERRDKQRNDPRFHVGWKHLHNTIEKAEELCCDEGTPTVLRHIEEAKNALIECRAVPHPKIAAVSDAIRPLVDLGEKVLVFCHHHATAAELLSALEGTLKLECVVDSGPPESVWRVAWMSVFDNFCFSESVEKKLLSPIIDWLCSVGIRWQVGKWIGHPALDAVCLARQLSNIRPRHASRNVPTIAEAACDLAENILDSQSKSTLAVLRNIAKGGNVFRGKSHFPGRLDEGLRVMGAGEYDGYGEPPRTLYTGEPDIVLALFNSPFGPDVLVTTDRLSEGVDLHRCCRHLIHYELDPSPVRTLQRNGRIRRVGSWAALTKQPIRYAYPTFDGTRDEKAVSVMRQRIHAFGLLLGGVPSLDNDDGDREQSFVEAVLSRARRDLESLNRQLAIPVSAAKAQTISSTW